ncbi:MAG: adenylate/guanylate cyclase domain-containing protein, partial [Patescibacteria group bacterium]
MIKGIFHKLLLPALAIATILSLALVAGLFSVWQEKLADNLFLPKKPSDEIIIIAIDDDSLHSLGQWPWDRKIHAQLLSKIKTSQPKIIGLDISFFEFSNPQSDQELAQQLDKNVVIAAETKGRQTIEPIEIFGTIAQTGITNTIVDPDGVTRKINLKDSFACVITGSAGCYPAGQMRINFVGEPQSFETISFAEVLENDFDTTIFNGKIVLVGATANDLHDTQIVPTSHGAPMSGVEIHANAVQTILTEKFLLEEEKLATIITLLILTIITIGVCSSVRIKIGLGISLTLIIVYYMYAFWSFDQGVIRNLIYPPLTIIISFVSCIVLKYSTESKQKRFLRKAFSHYVSEDVVKEIVANPDKLVLGGEKKTVTVLFSDIQGFTTISEKTQPEKLTSLLNDYLTHMTNIILANTGVVDKFIGDSVMAFWGAPLAEPDHAYKACLAALAMQRVKVGKFNTRIGINTGEVIVGNMGSDTRFDYTVLGDTVNIASRLEGLNKEYKT